MSQTAIDSLIVAAVIGLATLAYRHPAGYKRLSRPLLYVIVGGGGVIVMGGLMSILVNVNTLGEYARADALTWDNAGRRVALTTNAHLRFVSTLFAYCLAAGVYLWALEFIHRLKVEEDASSAETDQPSSE